MKPIPGFPLYYAGSDGRIYKKRNNRFKQLTHFIPPGSNYFSVYLCTGGVEKKGMQVHKLMAMAYFNINPSNYKVIHIDKDLLNNKPENISIEKSEEPEENYNEVSRRRAVSQYERLFERHLNFDRSKIEWKRYETVRTKGNYKNTYNYLLVHLKSAGIL